MEQSLSLEAKTFSASPEILRILWNLWVHYRIYKTRHLFLLISEALWNVS